MKKFILQIACCALCISLLLGGNIYTEASKVTEPKNDITYSNATGNTLLHIACANNDISQVQLLLEQGANINAKNIYNETPIYWACFGYEPNLDIIKLLLQYKPNLDIRDNRDNMSPLHIACCNHNIDVAKLLLEHGANPNFPTGYLMSPLHLCVKYNGNPNAIQIAKLLLQYGADPNFEAVNYHTPLHYACQKTNIEMVKLLLDNNSNVNTCTARGCTPLDYTIEYNCPEIADLLKQHGAIYNNYTS